MIKSFLKIQIQYRYTLSKFEFFNSAIHYKSLTDIILHKKCNKYIKCKFFLYLQRFRWGRNVWTYSVRWIGRPTGPAHTRSQTWSCGGVRPLIWASPLTGSSLSKMTPLLYSLSQVRHFTCKHFFQRKLTVSIIPIGVKFNYSLVIFKITSNELRA